MNVQFGFDRMSLHDWMYPAIGALVLLAWHEGRKLIKNFKF